MILLLITRDPGTALLAEAAGVDRVFVDLEILGKRERQAGRDTVVSGHSFDDVRRVREVLTTSRVLVRLNPPHPGTAEEVERAIDAGAQLLMLPYFHAAGELAAFAAAARGRVPVVGLVETKEAADAIGEVARVPGVAELYIGLNDLHLALRRRFMFEPLADGTVDRLAAEIRAAGLPFGFGGVARVGEGLVPGELVLAEHLRLGSTRVILSRTFQRGPESDLAKDVARLREAAAAKALRSPEDVEADRRRTQEAVAEVLRRM